MRSNHSDLEVRLCAARACFADERFAQALNHLQLIRQADVALAASLQIDLQRAMARWNRHTRDLNLPLVRRLDAAYDRLKRGG
ncbi:MAG: hypothetical protein IV097_11360 [Burkholderiaceae bacterium]|nr:hypothetical protein [Burkholderiaceae bacterium]